MSTNDKKNPILFFLEQSWLLMVSAIVFGCLLSSLNMAWGPKIAGNQKDKFDKLAGGLITAAKTFEPLSAPVVIDEAKDIQVVVQIHAEFSGDRVLPVGRGETSIELQNRPAANCRHDRPA